MSEPIQGNLIKGKLTIQNNNGSGTAIVFDGNALPQSGTFHVSKPDDLVLQEIEPGAGKHFITGQIDIKDTAGNILLSLIPTTFGGWIRVQQEGGIMLMGDKTDEKRIELNASERSLTIHSVAFQGKQLQPIKLDAASGVITNGLMKLMANGQIEIPRSMRLEKGRMRLGAEPDGQGDAGGLIIRNSDGKVVIELDAAGRKVHVLDNLILENGGLRLGSEPGKSGQDGMLFLNNAAGKETVRLDGKAGDLILQNADCAEDFDIASEGTVAAGTVMVLDDDGNLCSSNHAYDKRVAGVISGAGNYRPGIVLDRQPGESTRQPIALMGKVFCKVDARHAPITVGDLLTTSPTPGHAMKALDPIQAFGAVLGKALKPLTDGIGLIPILVSLQ